MTPEQRLRAALEAGADRVEFGPDALGTIRSRIGRRRDQGRRLVFRLASVATGLAATVTAVVIGVASCARVPAPEPPPVATTGPSLGPTAGPTTPPGPTGVTVRVPVYAVGRSNPVLYREFRPVVVPADTLTDRIAGAVRLMLASPPLDPDYATAWPAGIGVGPVTLTGSVATVDLTGVDGAAAVRDPALARAAVQQLVWTVTAVAADRGSPLTGVRRDAQRCGAGHPVGGGGRRGADPGRRGRDAGRDLARLTAAGRHGGAQLHRAAGRLCLRGGGPAARAQPGRHGPLGPAGAAERGRAGPGRAMVPLTLPPGVYTVETYAVSQKDGSEQGLDGHRITVR